MMIDRMTRLEDRTDEARALLRWLRALRQSPETENLRFLIAGSIGIDSVLNSIGEISTINDFQPLTLSDESREKILELVGIYVPYFLQILFSETSKTELLTGKPVTPELIAKIYQDKVLGMGCKTYFDHYYGRLRDYYRPQEEKAVKKLLRELARVGKMTPDACFALYRGETATEFDQDDFQLTLTHLENDFYICYDHETQMYTFSCKLLRDWWLRHYAFEVM